MGHVLLTRIIAAGLSEYAIPGAALIVAISSFVSATFLNARSSARTASSEWVKTLEGKIDLLEDDLENCRKIRSQLQQDVTRLSNREIELMRRVLRLENGK